MEGTWTKEQQKVIESRGTNLLVSAAAGSGKTAVLTERIMQRILDPQEKLDIDSLLVVTFTNAAAAEMKERIRGSLEQALMEHPEDPHLQQQVTLVHQAMIMTIHSFCLRVIRDHIQQIDLDPGFRVASEDETRLLKEEVLGQLLEEQYLEPDDAFIRFADTFATGKSDQAIADAVRRCYEYSMAYPDPAAWRRATLEAYEASSRDHLEKAPWMALIRKRISEELDGMRQRLALALDLARLADGPAAYEPDLAFHLDALSFHEKDLSFDALREELAAADQWDTLPGRGQPKEMDPLKKEKAKALRDGVKSDLASLRKKYFAGSLEQAAFLMRETGGVLRELMALTDEYQARLEAEKRERGIADFNDLEQYALRILLNEDNQPSPAAMEYAGQFAEVMTDEYQDSNMIQETILSCVSKADNRFMVGDVKQSIYKFRQARPELFMEKYHAYRNDSLQQGRRIVLSTNFRSRVQVLEAVNMVFRQLMAADIGGIDYDEDAALHPGASYPAEQETEALYRPELLLVEEAYQPGDDEYGMTIRQEAISVGRRIRKLMQTMKVYDKESGGMRPLAFGDIVILLRSMKGCADTYTAALLEMGIPAAAAAKKGYLSAPEVRMVLSLLQVIDNPRQDIPLAGVLSSPIGRLTDEELAMIRIHAREGDFYSACVSFLKADLSQAARTGGPAAAVIQEKLRSFFALLTVLREKAESSPVHLLIRDALQLTGYQYLVAAMPGGAQRKANLDMLMERAAAFEQGSYHGLFHFLRTIRQMEEADIDFGEASSAEEGRDCVRVMSIHTSKGLEFPVVFVGGLGRQINRGDTRERLILHPLYGAACDYVDTVRRLRVPVLYKNLLSDQMNEEMMGEELRILYVAMTRAREKLIMVGSGDSFAKKMERWMDTAAEEGMVLPAGVRRGALTDLDLIVPAVLRHEGSAAVWESHGRSRNMTHPSLHDGCGFLMRFVTCTGEDPLLGPVRPLYDPEEGYPDKTQQGQRNSRFLADVISAEEKALRKNGTIPGKVSVSFLKHAAMDALDQDSVQLFEPDGQETPAAKETAGTKSDAGEKKPGALSGAARGTLYHTILEWMDYEIFRARFEGRTEDFVQWQLESLLSCGKIQKDEREAVRPGDLQRFLDERTGQRMCEAALAGTLKRETPFVLGVPACEADPNWDSREMILVQGIIDAWFLEEEEIVLVDYKTDYVDADRDPEGRHLADLYRRQLDLYQEALERLTGRHVKERLLYSFSLGRAIPV